MDDSKKLRAEFASTVEALNLQIEQLRQQLQQVQQEKTDLEVLLYTITDHSDQILADIEQEKTDLEILLETASEHSILVENDLQNQVEEERRQREQQFQLITAATPVGLLISQVSDGQILYANEVCGRLLGTAAETLLEHQTLDFYASPQEYEPILNRLTVEQQVQAEILFKRVDGTPFWALVSLRPFVFQGIETLLTSISDISDRKRAEESLRIAEAKFRGIFENAVEGIFQSTPDGRYLEVNPAMASMFGYASPGEMLETVVDGTAQIYVDVSLRAKFIQLMNENGELKDFEYQVYHRDGHTFWISEWARAIHSESGELLYYEGSCVDITKRKQEEERLKQQLRELKVEIDQTKRAREVAKITQTDYFQSLLQEAESLRYSDD